MTRASPGARRREQIRVVADRELAEEHDVVDDADQVPEQHRAQAGHNADDERQHR